MKKITLCLMLILALLIPGVVLAENEFYEMTAEELLATAKEGTITLEKDVMLTTNLEVPSDVKVIDLGGKTLTIKGYLDRGRMNPLLINSKLEIKNGTIARDSSFKRGSLIIVDGSTAELTLNNVIVDGGKVSVESRGSGENGTFGIYVKNGASLFVVNKSIIQNHISGDSGGAIRVVDAKNVAFNNTTINNNYAKNSGSAIKVEKTKSVLIEKTTIIDNESLGNATVAIQEVDTFTFDKNSNVKSNKAKEAGGIHIKDSNATISGTIEGNEATASGGGLYTYLTDSTKTVIITDTAVIKGNIAEEAGGGVYVNADYAKDENKNIIGRPTGQLIMNGGTITGNTAKGTPAETTLKDGGGAGIYVARGSMIINGGTIENNTSTSGVGNAIIASHANGNTEAGKLTITGGTIKGSIALGIGEINITGGTFTSDVKEYAASGYTCEKVGDIYKVDVKYPVNTSAENGKVVVDKTSVFAGETVKITATPNEEYKLEAITVKDKDGKTVEVKDNAFVMPASQVTVTATFAKVTQKVEGPKEVEMTAEVEKNLLESLKEIAEEDSKLAQILKNNDVEVKVKLNEKDAVKLETEEKEAIEKAIEKEVEGIKIAKYLDISIVVKNSVTDEELDTIPELKEEITFTVAVPEDLPEVAKGYTRNYYIIRNHKGVIEIIKNAKLSEDGKSIIFGSDKFSTYAIAYNDVKEEEKEEIKTDDTKKENATIGPVTGDDIVIYVASLIISIMGIVVLRRLNISSKH